jgi:hypothetical protein
MSDNENVVNMQGRKETQQRKLAAQKIVEKHLATGKKLTQAEALTILAEMCEVVNRLELVINQLVMRLQSVEFQASSTAASGVALHRMLQDDKKVFTEEEFKKAWSDYVEKPLAEAKAEREKAAKEAQEKQTEKIKEQAKKDSLDAAEGKISETETSAPDKQGSEVETSASGDMSEPKSE